MGEAGEDKMQKRLEQTDPYCLRCGTVSSTTCRFELPSADSLPAQQNLDRAQKCALGAMMLGCSGYGPSCEFFY
jgi:hypothetical protein